MTADLPTHLHPQMVTIARYSEGMYVVDFCARVGARPYFRYVDGEWVVLSVGPWERTDDGRVVITPKRLDRHPTTKEVAEKAADALIVQLHHYRQTPFENPDDYEYVYGCDDRPDDDGETAK